LLLHLGMAPDMVWEIVGRSGIPGHDDDLRARPSTKRKALGKPGDTLA
jgi:hypothetical protein